MSAPASTTLLMPSRRQAAAVAGLLVASIVVHVVLFPTKGWEGDIHTFLRWMHAAVKNGVAHVDQRTCDYPPVYLYCLEGIGLIWSALFGALPKANTLGGQFAIKLLPSLCDVAIALMLYVVALARVGHGRALALLAAYAFNPSVLFDSAVWGQVDAILTLLLLLCAWLTAQGRIAAGFGVLAVAVLLKPQAIAVVPPLVATALYLHGTLGLLAAVRGFALIAVALLLPFYLAGTLAGLMSMMIAVTERYPYISMNAHNLWWLVGGVDSPTLVDATRLGSALFSYRAVGMALLGVATTLIIWRLLRSLARTGDTLISLCEACALQLLAFYLFPTQMHERYIVPSIAFVGVLCIARPRLWAVYALLSAATLVSLASTLKANVPQPLGPLESLLFADRAETFVAAAVFLSVFGVLLLGGADRRFRYLAPAVAGVALAGLATLAWLPWPRQVSLVDWRPMSHSQYWGLLQTDRSVDGRRLSVLGFIFRRGLGTHSVASTTYHLNGAFSSFETSFGADDEARVGLDVGFRISADGKVLHDSGQIKAGGFPRHVAVSVAGAEYLTLEVLGGGDGHHGDHADWLEPTLWR